MWMLPFKVSFNKYLCTSFFALTSTCNSCSYGIFIIIIIHTCVHTCVDQWSISGVSQEPRSLFGKGRVYHWPGAHQAKIAANLWSCLLCTGVHTRATTSRFFSWVLMPAGQVHYRLSHMNPVCRGILLVNLSSLVW